MGQTYSISAEKLYFKDSNSMSSMPVILQTKYPLVSDLSGLVYLYTEDGVRVGKQSVPKSEGTEKIIYFPDILLHAGQKYFLKWYSHDDWLAPMLAQTESPISVTSTLHEEAKQLKKELALDKLVILKEKKALEAERNKFASEMNVAKMKLEEKAKKLDEAVIALAKSTVTNAAVLKPIKYTDDVIVTSAERKVFSYYFDRIDTNKDDQITFFELKVFMVEQGFHVTDDDIRYMMAEADTDESGVIDFDEFCKVCKRAENFKTTIGWRVAQARLGEEIHAASRSNKGKRKFV